MNYVNINNQSADDIMDVLEHRTLDEDGLSWVDWQKRLEGGDAMCHIVRILVSKRNDPKYADLIKLIEDEIEGWL